MIGFPLLCHGSVTQAKGKTTQNFPALKNIFHTTQNMLVFQKVKSIFILMFSVSKAITDLVDGVKTAV